MDFQRLVWIIPVQWAPDGNDRIQFSVYHEEGKEKNNERRKKKKKASFINQLVKQEKLFYSELSMRPMEWSGNGFIREDS